MPSRLVIAGLALSFGTLLACQPDAGSSDKVTGVPTPGMKDAMQPDVAPAPASNPSAPTTVHGVNFKIHSQIDFNFCIETANGTTEGRSVTLQICSGSDFQFFQLPLFDNGTNILVENQGLCLDGRLVNPLFLARKVYHCGSGDGFRFTVLSTGQIQGVKTGKCLQVPGAASNAVVSFDTCDETKPRQLWGFFYN